MFKFFIRKPYPLTPPRRGYEIRNPHFFCYLVIVVICFFYPINWILNSLETRYREGIEDLLVDQANILAAIVGREMEEQRFDSENLHRAFDHAYARPLSAKI